MEASESLINSQGVIEVDQTTLDIPRFYLQRFLVLCPKLNSFFFSLLTWLCRGRAFNLCSAVAELYLPRQRAFVWRLWRGRTLSATTENLHLKVLTRQNFLCHGREPSFGGSDAAEFPLPRQSRDFIFFLTASYSKNLQKQGMAKLKYNNLSTTEFCSH